MKNERVVVVTGASAGVGRAVARAFAERGCKVALVARGHAGLAGAAREVAALGGTPLTAACDVADAAGLDGVAGRVERELGPIDVWVNNAMVSVFGEFLHLRPDEFRRVTDVTYHGYVHGTLAALRRMVPRDRGVVVQVGSALAYRGIPLQAAYCGAMHAVRGFTEAVRAELLHQGSRVKLTMPQLPAVNTPQFVWAKSKLPRKARPVPPIYQPEVAARAVVWSAEHPRRREPAVGRSTVAALARHKFFSAFGDRYLARKGYAAQMYDGYADPDKPNNLWSPVAGDYGAHGPFDDRAKAWSLQWAAQERRNTLLAGAGLAAAALWAARRA